MSDLISRADAIEAMCNDCGADNGDFYPNCEQKEYCAEVQALLALPSADAVSREPLDIFARMYRAERETARGGDAEMDEVKPQYMQPSPNGADLISRELAMERIANDNVVGGMERINEYNNSTEFNDYLDGISDAITTIFCDVPSADITETETCQKCQEATERVLNRQGDEIKMLKASAEAVHKPDYSYEADMVRRLRHGKAVKVVYVCDGRACNGDCTSEECTHTKDIEHAKNFIRIGDAYMESAEAVQGWIPCSERLPETPKHYYDRSLYLTCNKTGYITSIYWLDGWNCLMNEDGTIYRKHEMKDIVAWMPLPKPYREESEVDE